MLINRIKQLTLIIIKKKDLAMADTAIKTEEEKKEYFDSPEVLD